MECGIYGCPAQWAKLLPQGARRLRTGGQLRARKWDVLALTPETRRDFLNGWRERFRIRRKPCGAELSCGLLLVPGNCPEEWLSRIRADSAVSYGLSVRDSLTFSSLEEPTLCVQRALPRPDGIIIEPREIPLPGLPAPVEQYLPLLGLWLLCG